MIVETGIYEGGGTLLFAGLCHKRVIAVDCEIRPDVREALEQNPKIVLIEGDSSSSETAALVQAGIRQGDRVCVFLDSAHDAGHVAAELRLLGPLVSPGCSRTVFFRGLPMHRKGSCLGKRIIRVWLWMRFLRSIRSFTG